MTWNVNLKKEFFENIRITDNSPISRVSPDLPSRTNCVQCLLGYDVSFFSSSMAA